MRRRHPAFLAARVFAGLFPKYPDSYAEFIVNCIEAAEEAEAETQARQRSDRLGTLGARTDGSGVR
jgi:hypothetical protein